MKTVRTSETAVVAGLNGCSLGNRRASGFTLIEIMVVVAIIGMIMGLGVPTLYKALHKSGFRKTINDVTETCRKAREDAIMGGRTTVLTFNPREKTYSITSGGGGQAASGSQSHESETPLTPKSGGRIGDEATIEMLDVNLREYKDSDFVHIRFFQNGTSDEMTLILRTDRNEWAKISLEITTGLATVDYDPSQWK